MLLKRTFILFEKLFIISHLSSRKPRLSSYYERFMGEKYLPILIQALSVYTIPSNLVQQVGVSLTAVKDHDEK